MLSSMQKKSHSQVRPCASNEQKEQMTHSQETPCAYLTKVPQPSVQRVQIIVEKTHNSSACCTSNQRTVSHSDARKILATYSENRKRYECDLKRLSKKAQCILRHKPQVREQDGAVCWPKLRQRMVKTFSDVQSWNFDTWSIKQDEN